MSSDKKTKQLGMNFSTANGRLIRNILFNLVQKSNLDYCFHCAAQIESIKDFSIEHKIPWQDNDIVLFWDLNNIAFSHKKCNYRMGRKVSQFFKGFDPRRKLIKDGEIRNPKGSNQYGE
jgi:hypothetical protein